MTRETGAGPTYERARKRVRGAWAGAGPLLLAATVLAAGCGGGSEVDGAETSDREGDGFARVVNVEVERVEPGPFTEMIRITGTVEASRDVTLSAEESGVVREVLVEKGGIVRENQPIVRIDDRILRSQVEEARSRAELARETWERRRRLWEVDRVGSELAYLEARSAAEQATAGLRTLEERLARTVIRAPISGVLEDRMVEVGTMVAPGTPVARVVDLSPVEVAGGVPERYAADVERGDPVTVTFDVLEGQTFTGTVSFVGATVDPDNRTFRVESTIPNPGRAIKPEMVANVRLFRRELEDALVIPQDALVRVEDGFRVFVVEEEGGESVAAARDVALGPAQRNRVVVESGLDPGARVVVVGQNSVAAGDRVRVVAGEDG